jgi:hypothetical protein
MTTHLKYSFLIIPMLILFAVSGCKHEQKTTTKINSNGSCERMIVIKSASDTASSFPLPRDKSWEIRIEGDSEKVFVASKKFSDVNQLNNDYRIADKIGVEVMFEYKFRWFYTYYNYQEIYKSYFPFHNIPLTSFLTKEEYGRYEKGDTSKALKEKLDEFFMKSVVEEFYAQLVDSVESLRDPSLPVSAFQAKKTEFINGCAVIFKDSKDDIGYLEKILKLKIRGKLERQIEGIKKLINKKVDFIMNAGGSYINEVVMPGIILNSNASIVEGNKVSWNMNDEKFLYSDYIMTVESRIANPWVTYATGGVLIVLVALLMLPRMRSK